MATVYPNPAITETFTINPQSSEPLQKEWEQFCHSNKRKIFCKRAQKIWDSRCVIGSFEIPSESPVRAIVQEKISKIGKHTYIIIKITVWTLLHTITFFIFIPKYDAQSLEEKAQCITNADLGISKSDLTLWIWQQISCDGSLYLSTNSRMFSKKPNLSIKDYKKLMAISARIEPKIKKATSDIIDLSTALQEKTGEPMQNCLYFVIRQHMEHLQQRYQIKLDENSLKYYTHLALKGIIAQTIDTYVKLIMPFAQKEDLKTVSEIFQNLPTDMRKPLFETLKQNKTFQNCINRSLDHITYTLKAYENKSEILTKELKKNYQTAMKKIDRKDVYAESRLINLLALPSPHGKEEEENITKYQNTLQNHPLLSKQPFTDAVRETHFRHFKIMQTSEDACIYVSHMGGSLTTQSSLEQLRETYEALAKKYTNQALPWQQQAEKQMLQEACKMMIKERFPSIAISMELLHRMAQHNIPLPNGQPAQQAIDELRTRFFPLEHKSQPQLYVALFEKDQNSYEILKNYMQKYVCKEQET